MNEALRKYPALHISMGGKEQEEYLASVNCKRSNQFLAYSIPEEV